MGFLASVSQKGKVLFVWDFCHALEVTPCLFQPCDRKIPYTDHIASYVSDFQMPILEDAQVFMEKEIVLKNIF